MRTKRRGQRTALSVRQRTSMKASASRGGRSRGGAAGCPTATAPIGSQSPGSSSTSRTTSRQNIVEDTHAEPSRSPASATRKFCTPAPGRDHEHLPLGRVPPRVRRRCASRPSPGTAPPDTARCAARRRAAPAWRWTPRSCRPRRRSAIHASRIASSSRTRDSLRLQQHEPPRRRVVRRRRGDRRGDRPPYRPGVHRLVGELADRTPQGHRLPYGLRGAQPEHVVARRSRTSARAPVARRPRPRTCGQPAHHGDGQPGRLALDQVARRRPARRRWPTTVALSGLPCASVPPRRSSSTRTPGRADGHVGQPVAPGPPEGVGDDDADVDAERVPQPVADRAARRRRGPRAATARSRQGCWRRRPRPRP